MQALLFFLIPSLVFVRDQHPADYHKRFHPCIFRFETRKGEQISTTYIAVFGAVLSNDINHVGVALVSHILGCLGRVFLLP